AEQGYEVILIGRGQQCAAVRERGLRLETPERAVVLQIPIVERPSQIGWRPDDVVLLTMKTQDTASAVRDLADAAPLNTPVICAQNAVENERIAMRWFDRVYGICVMCPTLYLTPGVVQVWSSPAAGILDIGRCPEGVDDVAESVAAALRKAS